MSSRHYDPTRETTPHMPARDPVPDYSTLEGASMLARGLDDWWHSRGFVTVKHTVELARSKRKQGAEPECANVDRAVYVVRSNLVAGLPPR